MGLPLYIFSAIALLLASESAAFTKPPFIEFLFDLSHPLGEGYRITTEVTHLPAFAQSAKRICARGLWALYTAESFGTFENTTVYTVRGRDIDCTSGSVESVIKQINSVRPLAGLSTTADACVYFTQPKFVGTPISCATLTNFTLAGSIATYMNTAHRIFCDTPTVVNPPNNNCICINGDENGSYLIPNTSNYPDEFLGQIISGTTTTVEATCKMYNNPGVPFFSGLEVVNLGLVVPAGSRSNPHF